MTVRRVLIRITVVVIPSLAILFVLWSFFGGELLRGYVVKTVASATELPFAIGELRINAAGFTAHDIELEIPGTGAAHIERLNADISLLPLVTGKGLNGVVRNVRLVRPLFTLYPSSPDSTPDTTGSEPFIFPSYPLKVLADINYISRIELQDGRFRDSSLHADLADRIDGYLDLRDPRESHVSLTCRVADDPGTEVTLYALMNREEGSFNGDVSLNIADISGLNLFPDSLGVNVEGGSLRAHIVAVGKEDLSLSGQFALEKGTLQLPSGLMITDAALYGSLAGLSADVNGEAKINGLTIPLSARVEYLASLLWSARINAPRLHLNDFNTLPLGIEPLRGDLDLHLSVTGENDYYRARLKLNGTGLEYDGAVIDSISIESGIKNDVATLDRFIAKGYNGTITVTGRYDLPHGDLSARWDIVRSFPAEELTGWSKLKRLAFTSSGTIGGNVANPACTGAIALLGDDSSPLFTGGISYADKKGKVTLAPVDSSGGITATFDGTEKDWNFYIEGNDLIRAAGCLLADSLLPPLVRGYRIGIQINGTPSDAGILVALDDSTSKRQGHLAVDIIRNDDDEWRYNGELLLTYSDGKFLSGGLSGAYNERLLAIDHLFLSNADGRELLTGHTDINFDAESDSIIGGMIRHLELKADSLPVTRILDFVFPDNLVGMNGVINGILYSSNDTLDWRGSVGVTFPDKVSYRAWSNGFLAGNRLNISNAKLTDLSSGTELVDGMGVIDLDRMWCDTATIQTNELPVERLLKLAQLDRLKRYGGILNAQITASGQLPHPDLNADIHLNGGVIESIPGYWSNIDVTTVDSLYKIAHFNFGLNEISLFTMQGAVNRYNYRYYGAITGTNVPIEQLLAPVLPDSTPISGATGFTIAAEDGNADVRLSITSGRGGPIGFDSLGASVRLLGFDTPTPLLQVDSVVVDWGTLRGQVNGSVPLTANDSLSLAGEVSGNMMELLRRLSPEFTAPVGEGNFTFRMDGTIAKPRIADARLSLEHSGISVAEVIKELDELSVDVHLDSTGRVSVNHFSGFADNMSFQLANRFPKDTTTQLKFGEYNVGVLQFATGEKGLWAVVPGIMEEGWGGYFRFCGTDGRGYFELSGPEKRPHVNGELRLRNATFTIPLPDRSGSQDGRNSAPLPDFLTHTQWNVRVIPEGGCKFVMSLSQLENTPLAALRDFNIDLKINMELAINDDPEGMLLTGSLGDTLHIAGNLTASSGTIDFLGWNFQVDQMKISFNPAMMTPFIYGSAITMVNYVPEGASADAGEQIEVRMTLSAGGGESGQLEDLRLVLTDNKGDAPEQILKILGFGSKSAGKLGSLGIDLLGSTFDFRQWKRRIETQLSRWFGIDNFNVESAIAENFLSRQLQSNSPVDNANPGVASSVHDQTDSNLKLLDQTRVTVGKYVGKDVYLSYTGALKTTDQTTALIRNTELGMVHDFNVAYRITRLSPNLRLTLQYKYDSITPPLLKTVTITPFERGDLSITLRYNIYMDIQRKLRPKWLLN